MKKVILFGLIAAGVFTMTSCGNTKGAKAGSPESVAKEFTLAFMKLDFEGAKKLGTSDTQSLMDMMSSAMGMVGEEEMTKMKSELQTQIKEAESKKFTCSDKGADMKECKACCDKDGKPSAEGLVLKKMDGKWLVHMSKEEMQEKMGAGEE